MLPGQYILWQVFVSLEFPSRKQSFPLFFGVGFVQFRCRIWIPVPHVALHGLKSDHGVYPPSTKIKNIRNPVSIKPMKNIIPHIIQTRAHTRARTAHTRTNTHTYTWAHTRARAHTRAHTHTHTHTRTLTFIDVKGWGDIRDYWWFPKGSWLIVIGRFDESFFLIVAENIIYLLYLFFHNISLFSDLWSNIYHQESICISQAINYMMELDYLCSCRDLNTTYNGFTRNTMREMHNGMHSKWKMSQRQT